MRTTFTLASRRCRALLSAATSGVNVGRTSRWQRGSACVVGTCGCLWVSLEGAPQRCVRCASPGQRRAQEAGAPVRTSAGYAVCAPTQPARACGQIGRVRLLLTSRPSQGGDPAAVRRERTVQEHAAAAFRAASSTTSPRSARRPPCSPRGSGRDSRTHDSLRNNTIQHDAARAAWPAPRRGRQTCRLVLDRRC